MNMDNLNKWFMLAANIGVVAGIIFLGVELRQNNKLLEAEAMAQRNDDRKQNYVLVLENPDLRKVTMEVLGVTDESQYMAVNFYNIMLINFEHRWQQYDAGVFDLDDLNHEGMLSAIRDTNRPVIGETWELLKSTFHPDFVIWVDERI